VLELGAGTAQLGRALAPQVVRLDAVELYPEMVRVGRSLPGGDHPSLRWHLSSAEEFAYDGPYGLVYAAAALHWMDWDVVLPAIGRSLAPSAWLAIVSGLSARTAWGPALSDIVSRHSTIRNFQAFNLVEELKRRGLFTLAGHRRTVPIEVVLTVDAYLDWLHTQSGFARERMPETGAAFDAEVRALVEPYAAGGRLTVSVDTDIHWGRPRA
jgi:trans-aconitate methyltransferase